MPDLINSVGDVVHDSGPLQDVVVHLPRRNVAGSGAPGAGRPPACPAGDAAVEEVFPAEAGADEGPGCGPTCRRRCRTGWRQVSAAWAASHGAVTCRTCWPT